MRLSLIISAYNQRAALEKIFRALVLQTSSPEEILIADDGSEDGTQELIEHWKTKISAPILHQWHPHQGFLKTTIL
ncbi:MAG TPA: glycosyltransferase, partial [Verrucomicrobiae bacterium]|nr:glycosyltransferase [Verrucomicrobiae bacterium]